MNERDVRMIKTALRLILKVCCIILYNQLWKQKDHEIDEVTWHRQMARQQEASIFADDLPRSPYEGSQQT